jgi:uncharacterized protein YjiS (DUF1127 family)
MTTYTQTCSRSIVGRPAGALEILTLTFRQWMKSQQFKSQVARERRQLLEMPDAMLRDLGISRGEAEAEALQTGLPSDRFNSLSRAGC